MSSDDSLSDQRTRIDEIDQQILDLLAERGAIVHHVLAQKIKSQLPIYVPEREQEKTERFRRQAEQRGLDPEWAEDFLRMIMSASRASQSARAFPCATEEPQTVLIVGGRGGMGSLYKRMLTLSGHSVRTLDKEDWPDAQALAKGVSLAIVAVPIDVTEDTIERLVPFLDGETVLADFTSNKRQPLQTMLNSYDGPVLGLHPMHGPDVPNLSKQLMVVCPARDTDMDHWLVNQARLWGMRIVEAQPEQHDHVMNLVQGLRHFVALLHGSFMKEYDLNPDDILDFSSPIYRAELMMTGRIFAQKAELYADIAFANEERRQLLIDFLDHHNTLGEMVRQNDREAFIKEFQAIASFFGDFANQAREESGYLINRLADRFAD
jgi:chorismate mutase/prephenate dehydrogenase